MNVLETCMAILLAGLQSAPLESEPRTSKWTGITADFQYWMAGAVGTTETGFATATPTRPLDIGDDLMTHSGSVMTFGLQYAWPVGRLQQGEVAIRFEYQKGTWSGGGTLSEDLNIDGTIFSAGSVIATRLRLDAYKLESVGTVALDDEGVFRLILGGGVAVIYGTEQFRGSAQEAPLLGFDFQYGLEIGARVQPWPFAYGEVTFWVHLGELSFVSLELRALAGAQWGPLRFEVGYQLQKHDQFDLHLLLGGVFIEVAADF